MGKNRGLPPHPSSLTLHTTPGPIRLPSHFCTRIFRSTFFHHHLVPDPKPKLSKQVGKQGDAFWGQEGPRGRGGKALAKGGRGTNFA